MNSGQTTQPDPLMASNLSRRRKPSNHRNKANTLVTELYDIQSNPEEETRAGKIKRASIRLGDCILGQSNVVYGHVFGKSRSINLKLINMWRDCLSHEDKSEIFLPFGDQKVEIPYSNARIYPLDKIEKEFRGIFGVGKARGLTAGEEASIIESCKKYLSLVSREPLKIGRRDFDILEDILRECKLSEL